MGSERGRQACTRDASVVPVSVLSAAAAAAAAAQSAAAPYGYAKLLPVPLAGSAPPWLGPAGSVSVDTIRAAEFK